MRLLASILCLASCVGERAEPTRFVGTIEGARTLVFVVRDPSQTNAYACDGATSPALFEWFVNGNSDDRQTISSDGGTAEIEIDFSARTGTLTAGTARDFVLEPVDAQFGLYRGRKSEDGVDYEVGIILLDDNTQNGVVGIVPDTGVLTTVVSPTIVPTQTVVTLLNDVRIPIASALNAYAR